MRSGSEDDSEWSSDDEDDSEGDPDEGRERRRDKKRRMKAEKDRKAAFNSVGSPGIPTTPGALTSPFVIVGGNDPTTNLERWSRLTSEHDEEMRRITSRMSKRDFKKADWTFLQL